MERWCGCGGGKGRGRGGGGRGMGQGQGCRRGNGTNQGSQPGVVTLPGAASADREIISERPRQSVPRLVAVVEEERCTGCGICIDACMEQAISVEQLASISEDRCIGCGACIPECPNEALSLSQHKTAVVRGSAG
jgi:ferredoxin